jgi:hypothetical protein
MVRAAIALTIWIDAVAALVLSVHHTEEWLEVPLTLVVLSHYVWMPLRWALVLTLLIRTVRANPLRRLARAPIAQITLAIVLHVVLGFLSLIGWLMIVINTRTDEHVIGLVLHVAVPTAVVGIVARRTLRHRRQSGPERI